MIHRSSRGWSGFWLTALAYTVGVAVAVAVARRVFEQETWPETVVAAASTAIPVGLVTAWSARIQGDGVQRALRGLDRRQKRTARRAVWRGTVPEDPRVRTAAAHLAVHHLAVAARARPLQVVAHVTLVLIFLGLAVWLSPPWALGALMTPTIELLTRWRLRTLRRRLAVLDAGDLISREH